MGQRLARCLEEPTLQLIIVFTEPACGSSGWVCGAAVGPGLGPGRLGSTRRQVLLAATWAPTQS